MKTSSTRLAGLGTTIFAEMTELARRTGAINLGQGFPDTDGPDEILAHAAETVRGHGHHQYAPGIGIDELRRAIAEHQYRWYGLEIDPRTEVVVSTGATEAIAASLLGLLDPGDEIVVLEPYYDSYVAMIQMAGATRVPVTLRLPDFRLPVDAMRAAITSRTTAILLNSPHNPTGAVLNREELQAIAALAVEHDLVVISDEVYEHLAFGTPHLPIAALPGMRDRTITISSIGKSFSLTGWKIGWATGPAELLRSVMGVKQFLSYTSGAPLQPAAAAALGADEAYFEAFRSRLRAQRDLLCSGLDEIGFEVVVPEGTYFATPDVRPLGFDDGIDFCRRLPELAGVVAVPQEVFYDDRDAGRPLVRWAFCKRPEVLTEALDRLSTLT